MLVHRAACSSSFCYSSLRLLEKSRVLRCPFGGCGKNGPTVFPKSCSHYTSVAYLVFVIEFVFVVCAFPLFRGAGSQQFCGTTATVRRWRATEWCWFVSKETRARISQACLALCTPEVAMVSSGGVYLYSLPMELACGGSLTMIDYPMVLFLF